MLSWCLKTGFDHVKKTIPVTKNFIACVPVNTHALFMLALVPAASKNWISQANFSHLERSVNVLQAEVYCRKFLKQRIFLYLLGCSKKEEAKDCKKYDRFSC